MKLRHWTAFYFGWNCWKSHVSNSWNGVCCNEPLLNNFFAAFDMNNKTPELSYCCCSTRRCIIFQTQTMFATSDDNFINVFTRSLYERRSQKHKKTVKFALSGSSHVKAQRKNIDKIDPRRHHSKEVYREKKDKLWMTHKVLF